MGVGTRKPPPLPAPTDISSVANEEESVIADDFATDLSRRTDKTSYSIPEDGTPITISTKRPKDSGVGGKISAHHSQTSLLIEYFEAGKLGDKVRSRPSVRVRVTPSAHKRSRTQDEPLIPQTGESAAKPTFTRRVSLGNQALKGQAGEQTELSYSSESNISALPVEVEVFQHGSELSQLSEARGPLLPTTSTEISSMPPDSMLEGTPRIRTPGHFSEVSAKEQTMVEKDTLKAPAQEHSRSASQERIVKNVLGRVMGEQMDSVPIKGKLSSSKDRSTSREELRDELRSPRRKSGKKIEDFSPTESSLLSSNANRRSGDTGSVRSGVSASSINNPKLLQTVEDAIKRLILPELNALKEEQKTQKTQKNRDKFERSSHRDKDSAASYSSREELKRSLSKSKSTPNVGKSKPKVVLNRDGDNPGITLSGDSVKGRDSRSSRRRSSKDSTDSYRDEEKSHRKRSSSKTHRSRDAALAGVAAGALTAAALKSHESKSGEKSERRKRRSEHSKSRSRTTSMSESVNEEYRKKHDIPPMPLQSFVNPSEVTRDSILSEAPASGVQTPVREVSRGSAREVGSISPQTPTKTPASLRRGIDTQHSNRSLGDVSLSSVRSDRSLSKLKTAAFLGATSPDSRPISHVADVEQYETGQRELSPIQSVDSFKEGQATGGHREFSPSPRSGRSRVSSLSREFERKHSNLSMDSLVSSPSATAGPTRTRPQAVHMETAREVLSPHERAYDNGTPRSEADDFFEKNHRVNDMYRQQYEESNLDSPTGSKRYTGYSEESTDSPLVDRTAAGQQVRGVVGNAEYVHAPDGVESAVASLHEPSTLSSAHSSLPASAKEQHQSPLIPSPLVPQTQTTPKHAIVTTTNETSKQSPLIGHDPAHRLSPAKERWSMLKEQAARSLNSSKSESQQHGGSGSQPSNDRSVKGETTFLGATAIPMADDPMPEMGYGLDDDSDVTTNPSIIKGPIGGEAYGSRSHWPLDVTPAVAASTPYDDDADHFKSSGTKTAVLAGAGAATAAGIAAAAAARIAREQEIQQEDRDYQPSLEDEYNANAAYQRQSFSPQLAQQWKDEGYNSAAQGDAITPEPRGPAGGMFDDDGMYTPDITDDVFTSKQGRHASFGSHGMDSPLYDAANGKGIDRIQSRDVVALMDHLTVRDAQRNARDTEILVSLVRSAAEMRNQFEDMKKYIAQQDAMIMQNSNQKAAALEQRILQGPRPQPLGSPRVPRRASTDDGTEDNSTKKKNVFRRALKGLGMKSSNDLAHIETMLMQLLDDVEGLKAIQTTQAPTTASQSQSQMMNSYENLRATGDPGYEPEGQAGTSSTPNVSGFLSNASSKPHGGAMHSGYDGRRGSEHRISTVLEGDEELEEHEQRVLDDQYQDEERLLTPTQEVRRGIPQTETPPSKDTSGKSQDNTPKRKHKSSTSSIWGIPKISRWSKTTASTNPDGARDSFDQKSRPYSDHSQASSRGDLRYDDDEYEDAADDQPRSQAARSIGESSHGQSPSPLIPEEDYEGPKYQAHRNSLNLQHPQPRAGPNGRAMHLEGQAVSFAGMAGTPLSQMEHYDEDYESKHDTWGSNPSLVLGRNRPTSTTAPYQHGRGLSPIDSDGGYSDHSASEQARPTAKDTSGPPIPPKVALDASDDPAASGYNARSGGAYSSPYSGGHLAPLEPIQEVRYSLETDRGHRDAMTPSPRLGKSQGMNTPQRKITGPRQMPGANRNASGQGAAQANVGQVRRKPLAKEADAESIPSYRSSFESETF